LKPCINLFVFSAFYFLLTIYGLAQSSAANPCSQWTTVKTDTASGKQNIAARDVVLVSTDGGKTGLSIYSFLNSSKKVVVVSIQAMGAGKCVDKGDQINILFVDGHRLDLSNTNDFNCDGSSTMYFGGGLGKKDEMKLLIAKKIKTMRVWTRDDYMQMEFTDAQATALMETLKCLSNSIVH
jgi:prepilin-type processing-associated H-X9-DG protein